MALYTLNNRYLWMEIEARGVLNHSSASDVRSDAAADLEGEERGGSSRGPFAVTSHHLYKL